MASHYLNTSQMNTNMTLRNPADQNIGRLVCKNYIILKKLNEGSFGKVYQAIHQIKKEYYAVKIEQPKEQKKIGETLRLEAEILKKLNGEKGFPRLYYYIESRQQRVLVETLLGKNFDELFVQCNKKFSLKTTLIFLEQAVNRLEFLHNSGYIHRDIKPENFMIGTPPNHNNFYLIDFGLNMNLYNNQGQHIQQQRGQPLVGTARFTPVCSHQGLTQCRSSDLESLGYLAIYFLKGTLPWMNIHAETKEERFYLIGQKKKNQTPGSLALGLPKEFEQYFSYIFNLSFEQQPSYSYIRKIFRNLFIQLNYTNDDIFDWSEQDTQNVKSEKQIKHKENGLDQSEIIEERSEEDLKSKQNGMRQSKEGIQQVMNQSKESKQNGMIQSKESKRSSSIMWGRSQTCQNPKQFHPELTIRELKQDFKLIIQHNKIIQNRQFRNSTLSKQSEQEEYENLLFSQSDENYPYITMNERMASLEILVLRCFQVKQ